MRGFSQKDMLADCRLVNKNAVLRQLLVGTSPGSALWFVGWLMNVHSDHILRNLRKPGETGYKIPTGKGFNHEPQGGIIPLTTLSKSSSPITLQHI